MSDAKPNDGNLLKSGGDLSAAKPLRVTFKASRQASWEGDGLEGWYYRGIEDDDDGVGEFVVGKAPDGTMSLQLVVKQGDHPLRAEHGDLHFDSDKHYLLRINYLTLGQTCGMLRLECPDGAKEKAQTVDIGLDVTDGQWKQLEFELPPPFDGGEYRLWVGCIHVGSLCIKKLWLGKKG